MKWITLKSSMDSKSSDVRAQIEVNKEKIKQLIIMPKVMHTTKKESMMVSYSRIMRVTFYINL